MRPLLESSQNILYERLSAQDVFEALESSLLVSESILDQLPVIVVITDEYSRILRINQAGVSHLQHDEGQLLGKQLPDVVKSDLRDKMGAFFNQGSRTNQVSQRIQHVIESNDDQSQILWQLSHIFPTKHKGFRLSVAVGSNTSQLQRAYQSKLLENSKIAAISTLAGGVAHEMNNPLAIIMGYLHRLQQDKDISKDSLSYVNKIIKATDRLVSIVSHLNSFSEDTSKAERSLIDLDHLLSRVTLFLDKKLKEKSIKIVTTVEPEVKEVLGVYNQFVRIFECLLSNSIDAFDKVDESRDKTIEIRICKGSDSKLRIFFSDNGVGIDKEILSRVYEPFFTTKDVGRGQGLGLSVVYNIIQMHAGDISIKSEKAQGTRVEMSMPIGS